MNAKLINGSRSNPSQPLDVKFTTANLGDEVSDGQLIARIAAQDELALNAIYRRYRQKIRRFLWRYLSRDVLVDEAINQTLWVIWTKASAFDATRASVSTWIFGIAFRAGLSLRARAWRDDAYACKVQDCGEEQFADYGSDPTTLALGAEIGEAVTAAMDRLSCAHRDVMRLSFEDNLSYAQIAECLRIPENTVKTRMFHARRAMAKQLADLAH